MNKEVNSIILCRGYVEDAAVTPLVFTTELGAGRSMEPREALTTLAEDLFARYRNMYPGPNVCCKVAIESDDYEYCPKCGNQLDLVQTNHAEDFTDSIWDILHQTNDSFGFDGVNIGGFYHRYRWHPTTNFISFIQAHTYLCVPENAERIMAVLIELLKPGTFTEDDLDEVEAYIFPNTYEFASRKEWFNYYLKQNESNNA